MLWNGLWYSFKWKMKLMFLRLNSTKYCWRFLKQLTFLKNSFVVFQDSSPEILYDSANSFAKFHVFWRKNAKFLTWENVNCPSFLNLARMTFFGCDMFTWIEGLINLNIFVSDSMAKYSNNSGLAAKNLEKIF